MRRIVAMSLFLLVCALVPEASAATRTISLSQASFDTSEGSGITLTLTLSKRSKKTIKVDYTLQAGTATAGADFPAVSGTIKFKPGKRARDIDVVITNDFAPEPAETFDIALSNPVRATLQQDTASVTIFDDAPAAGELVINEVMAAPSVEPDQEYVEIMNVSSRTLDLGDATLTDDTTSGECSMATELTSGERAVYSAADVATEPCDEFPTLVDALDTVNLWSGDAGTSTLFDTVTYDSTFATQNVSWGLDPSQATTTGNDSETNWCATPQTLENLYDGANYGTPGVSNPVCPP